MKKVSVLFFIFIAAIGLNSLAMDRKRLGEGDYPEAKRVSPPPAAAAAVVPAISSASSSSFAACSSSSASADQVVLVSSDGDMFSFSKNDPLILHSRTIQEQLGDDCASLGELYVNISSADLELFKKRSRGSSMSEILRCLRVHNYLDSTFVNMYARWAGIMLAKGSSDLFEKVELVNLFGANTIPRWQALLRDLKTGSIERGNFPMIAKWYYLCCGRALAEVDPNSYGFSIQELLTHSRLTRLHTLNTTFIDRGSAGSKKEIFNLTVRNINNLDGLSNIPEIRSCVGLDLSGNRIKEIKKNSLAILTKMNILALQNNEIMHIDADAFVGLVGLDQVYLDNNKLTEFPCFERRPYSIIDLSNNQITDVPADRISHLPIYDFLDLTGNPLTQASKDALRARFGDWVIVDADQPAINEG